MSEQLQSTSTWFLVTLANARQSATSASLSKVPRSLPVASEIIAVSK